MLLHRPPTPALAPFVEGLWHFDETSAPDAPRAARERTLPTGCMDLVLRLSDAPVRIFADEGLGGAEELGHAVLAGARAAFHLRDTSRPSCSVGVHFRPGGASALFGLPADELAGRHTRLDELWGRAAEEARELLLAQRAPAARLEQMEAILLARRARAAALHPAVEHALARLSGPGAPRIEALAREVGTSHRRLIALFRAAVGLTPKVYARVRRLQRALELAARAARPDWTELALRAGYCDQAHLAREFRAIAGLTPGQYAPLSPERPNHVPVLPERGRSRTSKTAASSRL